MPTLPRNTHSKVQSPKSAVAHAAKAAATAAPKCPKSAEDIVQLVLDKAAAEEGAIQGGSAGGGSQRERVLFIGTQFSILYTFMYSPA
jgi:hypothetical protein